MLNKPLSHNALLYYSLGNTDFEILTVGPTAAKNSHPKPNKNSITSLATILCSGSLIKTYSANTSTSIGPASFKTLQIGASPRSGSASKFHGKRSSHRSSGLYWTKNLQLFWFWASLMIAISMGYKGNIASDCSLDCMKLTLLGKKTTLCEVTGTI